MNDILRLLLDIDDKVQELKNKLEEYNMDELVPKATRLQTQFQRLFKSTRKWIEDWRKP